MKRMLALGLGVMLAGCSAGVLNSMLLRDPASIAHDPGAPELALLELRIATWLIDNPDDTICAGTRATTLEPVERLAGEDRLRARFPQVFPLERCEERGGMIVDSETGGPATLFDVHEGEWRGAGEYRAFAGYQRDARRNGWRFYEARFERGAWHVHNQDLDIILTGEQQ